MSPKVLLLVLLLLLLVLVLLLVNPLLNKRVEIERGIQKKKTLLTFESRQNTRFIISSLRDITSLRRFF